MHLFGDEIFMSKIGFTYYGGCTTSLHIICWPDSLLSIVIFILPVHFSWVYFDHASFMRHSTSTTAYFDFQYFQGYYTAPGCYSKVLQGLVWDPCRMNGNMYLRLIRSALPSKGVNWLHINFVVLSKAAAPLCIIKVSSELQAPLAQVCEKQEEWKC